MKHALPWNKLFDPSHHHDNRIQIQILIEIRIFGRVHHKITTPCGGSLGFIQKKTNELKKIQ